MTRPPHPTFLVRRRHLALIGLLAALLLWLPWKTTSGQTTSVVVLNTYTTSAPGPAQVPVSQFPSGTSTVYFDYTVQTASPSDVGDVDVLINGTNGPYVATAPLDLKGTGNKFAALTTGSGIYPDGAYCLIMKIDGVPQTIVGGVPLAFRVGQSTYNFTCQNPPPDTGTPTETPTVTATPTQTPSATSAPVTVTPPTATPIPTNTQQVLSPSPVPQPTSTFTPTPTLTPTPTFTPTATPTATPVQFPTQIAEESLRHFVLAISSSMQVRHFGTLRLYIHGTQGRAVPGVSVHIDARGLGMIHQRNGTTNRFGLVTFTSLWPPHGGRLAISASKPSYDSVTVELGVG